MPRSGLAIENAKPALVEARALKPICSNMRAEPWSQGFGITKHEPFSCSLRNASAFSICVVISGYSSQLQRHVRAVRVFTVLTEGPTETEAGALVQFQRRP